jgi:hypothetical protein
MMVRDQPDYSRSTKGAATRHSVPPLVNRAARDNDRRMLVGPELRIPVAS